MKPVGKSLTINGQDLKDIIPVMFIKTLHMDMLFLDLLKE